MTSFRILEPADVSTIDAFLAERPDSSMAIRSNLRRAGVVYRQEVYHALYVGAFDGGRLCGVAAHCWNGMLILQAPEHCAEIAQTCVERSARRVTGLTGPLEQTRLARVALGLADAPALIEDDEWLFGLDLAELIVPAVLLSGAVTCRSPRADERDALCAWRLAYDIELLGASDTPETRKRVAQFLDAQIADHNVWVAVAGDRMVSLSAFNAVLPDIVQLGGIYTPPELRGHGYAKAAVAASLLAARERGVERAVLFTSNPNAARSYKAVGFRRLGNYGLIFFQ